MVQNGVCNDCKLLLILLWVGGTQTFLGVRHAFGGAGAQDEPLRSSAWEAIRSAGDNDRRSKRFCSSAVLCVSFTWQMVKNARNQISSDKRSKHAWSNCVLCIPYILSGSPNECNECWLHTCDVCVITTWRLGLRAPLVARNKSFFFFC